MTYINTNRNNWNQRTKIHFRSKFYDVEGFLNGASSLNNIELSELGNVKDKTLLHLQCHFGLDTLSWAREGAIVTGVDFSDEAIRKAHYLKTETRLDARFLCADIYDYGREIHSKFDIVFTSYGAICWLPDLQEWANIIADCLETNGTFYMVEFHPFNDLFAGYSYFGKTEPDFEEDGTYTENSENFKSSIYTWPHSLSDVITSLINAGIEIRQFNEFPYSPYNCFDQMEEKEPGKFYLKHNNQDLPLLFSIKGTKSHNRTRAGI
ncbi:class I SAM-dependent methyltransferase [Thiorhodococcus fuscus]|uniref:Class I SAM-dependent methyltransferase n=1 Tax=Thiorhodococcus fuscus TaxID=527200 RepID=A0ABW4Y4P8_9GAMM